MSPFAGAGGPQDHSAVVEDQETRSLRPAHLAIVDQLLPVDVADLFLREIAFERRERSRRAASGRFPYFAHVGQMKADEVDRGLEARDGRRVRRQPLIDPGLRLAGFLVGVAAAEMRVAGVSLPLV